VFSELFLDYFLYKIPLIAKGSKRLKASQIAVEILRPE
jgi:hypothetical protein